jgi:hypothetical protein
MQAIAARALGRGCNEDVEVEGQWPQAAWLEARAVEQGVVLGFGAFAAAGVTRTGEASASDVSE